MKKVFILLAAAVLISSCDSEAPVDTLSATPSVPEIATPSPSPTEEDPRIFVSIDPPDFFSEEDFVDYVRERQNNVQDEGYEYDDFGIVALTHYYRLKNPPPETNIYRITPGDGATIVYHIQIDGFRERIMIQYSSYFSYDIEVDGLWARRRFPEESHTFEEKGLTYYIWKGMGGDIPSWLAEWYNADGYKMTAQFPYHFTPEEVLGYISDLERVEIG